MKTLLRLICPGLFGTTVVPDVAPTVPTAAQDICTPGCTRWTQINRGEPVRVFHDISEWDPDFYANAGAQNPDFYLFKAIKVWEDASCVQLFEVVQTRAEAQVIVQYKWEDQCDYIGTALCVCDTDLYDCEAQADHSLIFTQQRPNVLTMYLLNCAVLIPLSYWIEVYIHELGHVLGMGHQYQQVVGSSVMGNTTTIDGGEAQIYEHDELELQRRHPCECIGGVDVERHGVFLFPAVHETGPTCKGCQLPENYRAWDGSN